MLNLRNCAGVEISRRPICCEVFIHHRIADKNRLTIQNLYGERLMLMAVQVWDNVHPLLKVIPVEWNHSLPYGLLLDITFEYKLMNESRLLLKPRFFYTIDSK